MRTLYIECSMGAAGGMLLAALYALLTEEQKAELRRTMNSLRPEIAVDFLPGRSGGIAGTRARVLAAGQEEHSHDCHHDHDHDHHHDHAHDHNHDHHHDHHDHHDHHHATLGEITAMIDSFALPGAVRERAKAVYALLAQAESRAHGVAVGEVHFHEVGMLDAVADITGVCFAMAMLGAERVTVSPVNLGSGSVRTAHGILPVPAPATAELLTDIPAYMSDVRGELCTPTGAALLRSFATDFGPMPAGTIQAVGCGLGSKEFDRPNCLRVFLCREEAVCGPNDCVTELLANIDDMTGEALGFALEQLLAAGALDAFYTPVQMKKNRPAVLLTVLCRGEDAHRLAGEILRCTSTFGVRRTDCPRYAMAVEREQVDTPYGPIRRKTGTGFGVTKSKWEYEDAAAAARAGGVSLEQVLAAAGAGTGQ